MESIATGFADNTSLFFNSELSKQEQKGIFSRKIGKVNYPKVTFDNIPVAHTHFQKHLGIHLDGNLNFNKHIHEAITKASKRIGIIRRLV